MSTDQFFFSVDVETTSTSPFDGELLSIGIVPVNSATLEILDGKHWALEYDPTNVDPQTKQWWSEQSDEAYEAAWLGERQYIVDAAEEIFDFVTSFTDAYHNRIFAANPVSFDHPWVVKLFTNAGVENPFSYRTLCMRSMQYGMTGGIWGQSRWKDDFFHVSKIPHHALWDATSQAQDLISMLEGLGADDKVGV